MAAYELRLVEDGGASKTIEIEADGWAKARAMAESELRDWIRDGDWGPEGASVEGFWRLLDEEGEEKCGFLQVEVAPE